MRRRHTRTGQDGSRVRAIDKGGANLDAGGEVVQDDPIVAPWGACVVDVVRADGEGVVRGSGAVVDGEGAVVSRSDGNGEATVEGGLDGGIEAFGVHAD